MVNIFSAPTTWEKVYTKPNEFCPATGRIFFLGGSCRADPGARRGPAPTQRRAQGPRAADPKDPRPAPRGARPRGPKDASAPSASAHRPQPSQRHSALGAHGWGPLGGSGDPAHRIHMGSFGGRWGPYATPWGPHRTPGAAARRVDVFISQELADTAWASATAAHADALLCTALARAAEWRVDAFSPQEQANSAWAFATTVHAKARLSQRW